MKPYQHVAVIGVDGMGNFNRFAPTPCMDRIFAHGARTYDAYSMDPTISAENWGGMLLGADPAVHGLTNGYISCHSYRNDALPSVFRRIREAMPQAYLASVVNWEPINIGIVEDGIGVDKRTADNDKNVTAQIIDCVLRKPTFLFAQLDDVDGAGHHFGYGTTEYLQTITGSDALVGEIYDAYVRAGIADDTLFVCITDHGGTIHSHGGWSETEKYVFLAAAGRTVADGTIGFARTKDIAAIVLHALGLPVPSYTVGGFTSQIPQGLFRNGTETYILPAEKAPAPHLPVIPYDAPDGLRARFGERVRFCAQFENDVRDEAGRCRITQHGAFKYYSNGACGAAAEFGATGAFTVDGLPLSGSFSLCFWLLADADLPQDICVLGNKSPENGLHQAKGFNVILRNHAVMLQFGCGDDDTDSVSAFGADGFRGWIHVIASFDAESRTAACYLDFEDGRAEQLDPRFFDALSQGAPFVVGDDARLRFNRSRGLIFRMDDLLVLDGAVNDTDLQKLKDYYRGVNTD